MTNTFSGARRLIELDTDMVSLPHATTNVGPSLESSKLYLNHALNTTPEHKAQTHACKHTHMYKYIYRDRAHLSKVSRAKVAIFLESASKIDDRPIDPLV